MTGFLTIAINHKGYGLLAYNLAGSLHAFLPEVKISLIADERTIKGIDTSVFDKIILVEPQNAFALKTKVYDLTPYERTIYVDADSAFISDPSSIIELAEAEDFAMMEYRRYGKEDQPRNRTIWIDMPEAWKAFKLSDEALYPEYNSSIFTFRKCREMKKYFKAVQSNYDTNVALKERVRRKFPDEVAFSAASAQLGKYNNVKYWSPAYLEWPGRNKLSAGDARKLHQLVTLSGRNELTPVMKQLYNGTIVAAGKKLGREFYLFNRNHKPS